MQNFLFFINSTVKSENCHIFLSSTLLRLDESGGTLDADNEATGDLGVKRAAVACFFNTKYAFDPGNDLMR